MKNYFLKAFLGKKPGPKWGRFKVEFKMKRGTKITCFSGSLFSLVLGPVFCQNLGPDFSKI